MVIVDAPVRVSPRSRPIPERSSAIGFTPGCRAKYLSSYRSVASISSGEMSRNGVQIRNFWSDVRVRRRRLPFRSRTDCENEMPSSNDGFGNKNQTTYAVIPSETRALTHGALITRRIERTPRAFERSLTPFGMTRVFILFKLVTYSVTLIFPPTPRPFTLRSYIDSANTGGTTNSPRLDDFI
jgi:hypothetical protein